ncbi:ApeP family dehydratase [Paraburkholderia susongensis]|uniref:Predicted 3-hydroxylacyl-ACP dehydratase, HotDog domain n=1 Tax=Paraburkholderia susongensis TaxID=1515439 RepID=A0A1X7IPA2_9BURK|nr:beta-hydroxyacyl-ACP dehydratase [Paraburkholderia susongensis]SMG16846.1 Predicted 3-hydroxylacyl-ACP dehydratase, HotDog domain [Paraburkholderia susongensis]
MTTSLTTVEQLVRQPIEAIIPHRGSMLLIDAVDAFDETTLSAHASVDPHAWYADADADGAMPAWIGIELMAQAIAAHIALLAIRNGGHARHGVLLGSRSYQALQPVFGSGARLSVHVSELLRGGEGHSAYECTIDAGGVRCAEAVIKVYQPPDFQSFIEGSISS